MNNFLKSVLLCHIIVFSINEHGNVIYSCDQCEYTSFTKNKLNAHMYGVHHKERFPCDQCDKDFRKIGLLKKHKESKHDGVSYPCDQCPYTGSSKALLKSHKQSKHAGVFYPCGQCSYTSSSMSNLKRHYKAKHVGKNTHGSKEGNVQIMPLSREKQFQVMIKFNCIVQGQHRIKIEWTNISTFKNREKKLG